MKTKHTQRTLKHLRDLGQVPEIVERWIPMPMIPGGGKRKDFLNIIDILSLDKEAGLCIGVQSTGSDFRGHFRKITEEYKENSLLWLSIPCHELYLYGWRKVKEKRGGKRMVYRPRIHKFTLEDFEND